MIDFTSYDPATGKIQSTGSLSEESFEANVQFGLHAVLDVKLSESTHYIDVSGDQHTPREYTDDEKAALAGLAPGWVWEMPARRAVDQRTTDATRANKMAEMSAACAAQIIGGFDCDALGTMHHYPFKPNDQLNLTGSITDSLIPDLPDDWTTPFWCVDGAGVWEMRPHTATQIRQVGRVSKVALLAAMKRNDDLATQIMESSIAQIDLIHW